MFSSFKTTAGEAALYRAKLPGTTPLSALVADRPLTGSPALESGFKTTLVLPCVTLARHSSAAAGV